MPDDEDDISEFSGLSVDSSVSASDRNSECATREASHSLEAASLDSGLHHAKAPPIHPPTPACTPVSRTDSTRLRTGEQKTLVRGGGDRGGRFRGGRGRLVGSQPLRDDGEKRPARVPLPSAVPAVHRGAEEERTRLFGTRRRSTVPSAVVSFISSNIRERRVARVRLYHYSMRLCHVRYQSRSVTVTIVAYTTIGRRTKALERSTVGRWGALVDGVHVRIPSLFGTR